MAKYEVRTKPGSSTLAACLRETVANYHSVGPLYEELFSQIEVQGWTPAGASLALYYDEGHKESDIDVEVAVPLSGVSAGRFGRVVVRELPAYDLVASLTRRGPWDDFTQAYNELMLWIRERGYRIVGPNREIYLKGPESGAEPSEFLVEIQFPVAKAA
jgi:effector-binding domain-containing protein